RSGQRRGAARGLSPAARLAGRTDRRLSPQYRALPARSGPPRSAGALNQAHRGPRSEVRPGRQPGVVQIPTVGASLLAIISSGASFASKLAPTRSRSDWGREGRKERERPSCRAQLAALQSQLAADCEGAAEQARLYLSRRSRRSRPLRTT